MKYLKVVEIENTECVPHDELKAMKEVLYEFIDYLIKRMHLRKGQFLKCKARMEYWQGKWHMHVVFSRFSGTLSEPGMELSTTNKISNGPIGAVIIGKNIFQEIDMYFDYCPVEMSLKKLARWIVQELKYGLN